MYKALVSFTTKDYDVKQGQILQDNFTTQAEITEFLNIGYIRTYSPSEEGIHSNTITDIWVGTYSQYEGLTPEASTLYFITEA